MLLENEHIQLRAIEPEDLELLYVWENNPEYWYAGDTRSPYSKYVLKQHILDCGKDIYESKQLRLMIYSKDANKNIGVIDLFDFDAFNSRVAVGILIDKPHQGNGVANMSLELIENYVFDYLKIHQIYAHVADDNSRSKKLFEARNFKPTCVLKDWNKTKEGFVDVILLQLFGE